MIPALVIGGLLGYAEGYRRGLRKGWTGRNDREWIAGFVDGLKLRGVRKDRPTST